MNSVLTPALGSDGEEHDASGYPVIKPVTDAVESLHFPSSSYATISRRALTRGLAVLTLVAAAGCKGISSADVSQQLCVDSAVAVNLLKVLVDDGYLVYWPNSRRYAVAQKTLRMADRIKAAPTLINTVSQPDRPSLADQGWFHYASEITEQQWASLRPAACTDAQWLGSLDTLGLKEVIEDDIAREKSGKGFPLNWDRIREFADRAWSSLEEARARSQSVELPEATTSEAIFDHPAGKFLVS